jgi:hypothetical protein
MIIILVIASMQSIYNYILETNHVSRLSNITAVLHLQFVIHGLLLLLLLLCRASPPPPPSWVKQLVLRTDDSTPSSAEFKNDWTCTIFLPYAFMACKLTILLVHLMLIIFYNTLFTDRWSGNI